MKLKSPLRESDSYAKEIAKATKDVGLLVIGHHPKNAFLAALIDSVDERVADLVSCPVLVVPKCLTENIIFTVFASVSQRSNLMISRREIASAKACLEQSRRNASQRRPYLDLSVRHYLEFKPIRKLKWIGSQTRKPG